MIDFSNKTTYRDYFSGIADHIAGIANFKYGDDKAKAAQIRTGVKAGATLWLDKYPPITGAGSNDGVIGEVLTSFVVMIPANDRNHTRDEQDAFEDQCEALVLEIFRKIKEDFDNGSAALGNVPQFARLKFGSTDPIEIASSKFAGCAAELPFHIPLNI